MKLQESIDSILPYDVALKVASHLPVKEVCALGSCSRFWSQLCRSDPIWVSVSAERWPSLQFSRPSHPHSDSNSDSDPNFMMSSKASSVVNLVKTPSIEVRDYLKAIEDINSIQLSFKDVELFLFKPELNVVLNLLGLHYCINWLQIPSSCIMESLEKRKISKRQVSVQWWKVGRWFHGFRLKDESRSRSVSLEDVAMAKEDEVLGVLQRGAVYEVIRVQVSIASIVSLPWTCQTSQSASS
ncbi:hypothetical protein V2J09_015839 [Rumex salicifolius]